MNTVDDEIDWDAPDVQEALAEAASWRGEAFSVIPHDGISFGGKAEKLEGPVRPFRSLDLSGS